MSKVEIKSDAPSPSPSSPARKKSVAPSMRGKSFMSRSKSIKKSDDNDSGSGTTDVQEQLNAAVASRLRDQLQQLLHRLETEGKKVAENASKIEQLEVELRDQEQSNIQEGLTHEDAVTLETAKLEELQTQLGEAMRESDALASTVSEVVDGAELKKRSNALRMEQLVNFVLSSSVNDVTITAEEIDRDVTGERIRALALYEEGTHEGRALRVTYQRRRELWENYENLWLRESDPCFKPKYSDPNTSYHTMLDPHRCRWNTCVLDRCASEYMTTRLASIAAVEGPTVAGTLMAARAAKKFAAHRRSTSTTPSHQHRLSTLDADEEYLFPKASRR
jgi:hypothetical protein